MIEFPVNVVKEPIIDAIFIVYADQPDAMNFVLMHSESYRKYNLYILPYNSPGIEPLDPMLIYNSYLPETLETAQDYFPSMKFTKKNYGF